MRPFPSYRAWIYAGTLLTGSTGLVYQVTWQKYLSFVVGSEARSVALVVATFLAGLAAGYRFWGRLTETRSERRSLLRIYGLIEIGIGAYAAIFPFWIELVRGLANRAPAGLLTDVAVAAITLVPPTFLMGATIPLLVSVVPERVEEVHLCHAKIYGINTLGACVGSFAASFLLIPQLGLAGSLWLGAAVNLVVGTFFALNSLSDRVVEKAPIESIPNRFPTRSLYFYTLVTGTVTLSFEVLFIRVLGLTIGTGPHNFAIVVGVFIFGLALGSLILTERMLSLRTLFASVLTLIFSSIVIYYTVPYWPYWLNNVRVMLRSIPINHGVYLFLVTGFLCLMLLAFLVPLGTMLPLVYALLPKNSSDYGKKCGWLYFYSTLGTAFGAVVLSHLMLRWIDLDQVFKINVALIAALAAYLLTCEKRRTTATVVVLVVLAFLAGPRWDRGAHHVGLFRHQTVNPFNFQGLFQIPVLNPNVEFFDDGPDTTVSVMRYGRVPPAGTLPPGISRDPEISASLVINGKSDGDTIDDYTTITLAAMLPYLHAPARADLDAAVIGLGTGITAGLLASGEDVARLTVVEISSTLVEAAPSFDIANFGLRGNPKVRILDVDGFKYFARLEDKLDVIVSATSPPWVVGVENLFTPEFYRLAHDSLSEDGVFMQWFPLYTMDPLLFRTVLFNVGSVFPQLRLYQISDSEMGILAARSATSLEAIVPERFDESAIRTARLRMELHDPGQLELIRLYDTEQLSFLVRSDSHLIHTLGKPSLAYASDRLRFEDADLERDAFLDPRLLQLTRYDDQRRTVFRRLIAQRPDGLRNDLLAGERLLADQLNDLQRAWRTFSGAEARSTALDQLEAYDLLRREGVHPRDPMFLGIVTSTAARSRLPVGHPQTLELVQALVLAHVRDGLWDELQENLLSLRDNGIISQAHLEHLARQIDNGRQMYSRYVQSYRVG